MRVMAKISIPAEAGNEAIVNGQMPKVIQQTVERWKPEAMYFGTFDGRRSTFMVFDLPDPSYMPVFAEPFFLQMKAEVEVSPVMNAEDLQKGLSQL